MRSRELTSPQHFPARHKTVTNDARYRRLTTRLGLLYLFATPLDFVPTPFLTPASFFGLLFLAVWGFGFLVGKSSWPPSSPARNLMALVALWSLATMAWSVAPSVTANQAYSLAVLVVGAFAISVSFSTDLRQPARAMVTGTLIASIATMLGGRQYTNQYGNVVEGQQSTFLNVDQNALAFHLALGLACVMFLLLTAGKIRWEKPLLFVSGAVIFTALLLAGSRTGAGSAAATVLIFATLSTNSVRRLAASSVSLVIVGLVTVQVAAMGLLPQRLVSWAQNPFVNDSRTEIIDQYRLTQDVWWLKGIGAGADADYLLQAQSYYTNAHSAFWKTWIETGLIGLVLWTVMLIAVLIQGWRTNRQFFILMLPTLVAFFYTLGPLNSNMLWAIFGLALVSPDQRHAGEETSTLAADRRGKRSSRKRPSRRLAYPLPKATVSSTSPGVDTVASRYVHSPRFATEFSPPPDRLVDERLGGSENPNWRREWPDPR